MEVVNRNGKKCFKIWRHECSLEKSHMYGHYVLTLNFRGKEYRKTITDAEVWDYIDSDENRAKRRAAEARVRSLIKEKIQDIKLGF